MQEIKVYYWNIGLLDDVIEKPVEQGAQQASIKVAKKYRQTPSDHSLSADIYRPLHHGLENVPMVTVENWERLFMLIFLTFGVLRGLSGFMQAVFLSLLHPRIAGEETASSQQWSCIRVSYYQRPGDSQLDSACLAGNSAAMYAADYIETTQGITKNQRLLNDQAAGLIGKEILKISIIYSYFAISRYQSNPGDGFFSSSGSPVLYLCHNDPP
jgi:hypothetical protein